MSEWISVERMLPPKDVDVLLVHVLGRGKPSGVFLGWRGETEWYETRYYCPANLAHPIDADQVTHWRLLPEPPQVSHEEQR